MNKYTQDNARQLGTTQAQKTHGSVLGLIFIAILTVVLFNVPYGRYIMYPFIILGTWFHEMGHGLTSLATGGVFKELVMSSDGSGHALVGTSNMFAQALVSAAGLMSPPVVGAGLILAGKTVRGSRIAMMVLGVVLLASVVIWVRSMFGLVAVSLWGALILTFALKLAREYKPLMVQFLGVQAWASAFLSLDYAFSNSAHIGVSDTQAIANILVLPYWFWGGLISLFAIVMLFISLRIAFKK